MTPYEFQNVNQSRYKNAETRAAVMETVRKLYKYFSEHESILVSVSGGSDSDCIVHLICTYFREFLSKIHFVFVNPGLEYEATKRHLCDLEKRYNITLDRIRGKSVVTVCRKYGFPILNKTRSSDIYYYLRGAQWAVDRIDGNKKAGTRYEYTENMRTMIHYIKENGISISERCCTISKKSPLKQYMKKNGIELNVTGERKAEGGQRATTHKACFEIHKDGVHKYMPLWWWTDEVKQDFKESEGIVFSDCYEVWGFMRTGCVGCPFDTNISEHLRIIRKYEPKLFRACMNVFGQSYDLMDKFKVRRKRCMPEPEGEKDNE